MLEKILIILVAGSKKVLYEFARKDKQIVPSGNNRNRFDYYFPEFCVKD